MTEMIFFPTEYHSHYLHRHYLISNTYTIHLNHGRNHTNDILVRQMRRYSRKVMTNGKSRMLNVDVEWREEKICVLLLIFAGREGRWV